MIEQYIKTHWFWPLSVILLGLCWIFTYYAPQEIPQGWELAVIFDILITLPILFFLCYRKTLSKKMLAFRIIALQCFGIWLASKIIPTNIQIFLPQLVWMRYVGLLVIAIVELRLMIALFKLVFRTDTQEKQLEEIGMPPLLAKLALMEARFWQRVISFFRK